LGREKRIQEMFDDYLDGLASIGLALRDGLESYLLHEDQSFEEQLGRINALEGHLDEIRRSIEMEIYSRRLLPDTRGDVLSLLESVDKIPNRIQSVARNLKLQHAELPGLIGEDLIRLAGHIVDAIKTVIGISRAFLERPAEVQDLVTRLQSTEHEADVVEQRAIAAVFDAADPELAHKLQLQGLIERIGSVCDLAEDVGDRMMIASIKRVM
jgi:predicted phosphate transport protein (TIGR00153 family)